MVKINELLQRASLTTTRPPPHPNDNNGGANNKTAASDRSLLNNTHHLSLTDHDTTSSSSKNSVDTSGGGRDASKFSTTSTTPARRSTIVVDGTYDEFEKFLATTATTTTTTSEGDETKRNGDEAKRNHEDVGREKKSFKPSINFVDAHHVHPTAAAESHPSSATGQCPFRHGTVYARPYPGYAHGNSKKGVCPKGCRPETDCDITERETSKETLVREATEFIELYYHEREDEMKGSSDDDGLFQSKEDRLRGVLESIESTGSYEHTFDELQHGARVAWRNAPKCSNRKYWQDLKLIDCRTAETNKDMFDCCLQHLSKAMTCGSAEAYISVFKPAKPGTVDGPRIWNEQLLSYAAYGGGDDVTGDKKNLRFTQMLDERFGWKGPSDGKQGAHDYLPLVIQADPNGKPELFELPLNCAPPVHIFHPKHPELSQLKLEWYPIPAVCALDMTLGGIHYTAVPFNGWYADTEVLRDFIDESRYNLMIPIAKALGMKTDLKPGEPPYYKEDVLSILCKAIYHSFKSAKVAMIDHHNLIDMFWDWYCDEMASRKFCPVNWKWVMPPVSASTNKAYLGLCKAQEYTLKPAYLVGKGFVQLEEATFGKRCLDMSFVSLGATMTFGVKMRRWLKEIRSRKQQTLIIYASATGNSAHYASGLGSILNKCCNVTFFDACGANAATDTNIMSSVQDSIVVIFVSSTQGNGEIPSLSKKFFSLLFRTNGHLLKGKECAVLGFGSSAYPIFCGGAAFISDMLAKSGATELVPRGECDAVKGEAQAFQRWTSSLVEKMASKPSASPGAVKLFQEIQDNKNVIIGKRHDVLDSLSVQIFTDGDCRLAAGNVFSRRSSFSGSMIGGALQRSSSMESAPGKVKSLRSIMTFSLNDVDDDFEDDNVFVGSIKSQTEMINKSGFNDEEEKRGTSLVKIDISCCGNPPYQPGDHVRIYPHNDVSQEKLEEFVGHLSRNLTLDDQIYATLSSEELKSDLKVHLPLLNSNLDSLVSLRGLFEREIAVGASISMEACADLAQIASDSGEKCDLQKLGGDEDVYEDVVAKCGLKWIDLFEHYPSLSKKVSIEFLLCSMKKNHVRSYSIASCKAVVGSEMHLVVGRFLYSRGSGDKKKIEVGVCSNYLTSISPDEEVMFELESMRSFHLPSDQSGAIFLICTGTGYAPMRGLLQKRAYLQRRGEDLGPVYLIFGSRSSSERLFQEEIRQFHEEGVLSGVFICYSREPGSKKEYTTDKLRSPEVKTVLNLFLPQANTHFFICGSANMAEECKTILGEIASPECFNAIDEDGRIHCDVFGALATKK